MMEHPRPVISRRAWLVYIGMCLIFGTTFLAIRIGARAEPIWRRLVGHGPKSLSISCRPAKEICGKPTDNGKKEEYPMKASLLVKLVIPSILAAAVVAASTAGIATWEQNQIAPAINASLTELTRENLSQVTRDMYTLVDAVHQLVRRNVESGLRVLKTEIARAGTPQLSDETMMVSVSDQFTGERRDVEIPVMTVGEQELRGRATFAQEAPFVDATQDLVAGTATIFVRMNEAGDMLRIESNVRRSDGTRAVGTYIPAVNPDGSPNPVVAALLTGDTFRGRAFVVNAYYQTIFEPLLDASGEVIGALYFGELQEAVGSIREAFLNAEIGETGYVFALGGSGDQQGEYIVSLDGERDGEVIWDARSPDGRLFIQDMIAGAKTATLEEPHVEVYPWTNEEDAEPLTKMSTTLYFEPWDWVIGVGVDLNEMEAVAVEVDRKLNELLLAIIVTGVLFAIIAGLISWLMVRRVVRPLRSANQRLAEIADGGGDLTARLAVETRDEVGELSESFNDFLDTLQEMIGQVQTSATESTGVQEGVLSSATETSSAINEITANIRSVNGMSESLRGEVASVSAATEQIQRNTQQLTTQADSQSSAVTESSASVEQMISGLHNVARITESRRTTAEALVEGAARNSELAVTASEAMHSVSASVDSIREMAEAIAAIASQTNLLAMNAAIEAAHAGESGKGFAVVADEIRKLAETSSESSREIATNVTAVVDHIQTSAAAMEALRTQLDEIATEISQTADAFTEIHGSTTEISTGGDEIVRAMSMLTTISSEVVQAIREISESTSSTAASMASLSELSGQLSGATDEISTGAGEIMTAMNDLQTQVHTLDDLNRSLADRVDRFTV